MKLLTAILFTRIFLKLSKLSLSGKHLVCRSLPPVVHLGHSEWICCCLTLYPQLMERGESGSTTQEVVVSKVLSYHVVDPISVDAKQGSSSQRSHLSEMGEGS